MIFRDIKFSRKSQWNWMRFFLNLEITFRMFTISYLSIQKYIGPFHYPPLLFLSLYGFFLLTLLQGIIFVFAVISNKVFSHYKLSQERICIYPYNIPLLNCSASINHYFGSFFVFLRSKFMLSTNILTLLFFNNYAFLELLFADLLLQLKIPK